MFIKFFVGLEKAHTEMMTQESVKERKKFAIDSIHATNTQTPYNSPRQNSNKFFLLCTAHTHNL